MMVKYYVQPRTEIIRQEFKTCDELFDYIKKEVLKVIPDMQNVQEVYRDENDVSGKLSFESAHKYSVKHCNHEHLLIYAKHHGPLKTRAQ